MPPHLDNQTLSLAYCERYKPCVDLRALGIRNEKSYTLYNKVN